jgi:hypothetical protein
VVVSVPCRVSSELHAGGHRVIGINAREANGMIVTINDKCKVKREWLMSTEGREIIGPGYPKFACGAGQMAVGDEDPADGSGRPVTPKTQDSRGKATNPGANDGKAPVDVAECSKGHT